MAQPMAERLHAFGVREQIAEALLEVVPVRGDPLVDLVELAEQLGLLGVAATEAAVRHHPRRWISSKAPRRRK